MIFFSQGALLGVYAALLPGPFQAFMLSQSLRVGWRHSMPLAVVPLLTDLPVMLVILFLLSQTPAWFINILRFGGGVYLFYLAYGAYRSIKHQGERLDDLPDAARQSFAKSILINYLNPNVYIFWGTVGVPIILKGMQSSIVLGILFVIGFYLTLLVLLSGMIMLFGNAGKLPSRFRQGLGVLLAGMLLFFGGYQIWLGASDLLA